MLFLARAPLGSTLQYYIERDGRLDFVSEVKVLLALPFVTPDLDEESLDLCLAFRLVPSPRTFFRRIHKVGPGEMLIKAEGQMAHIQRYALPPKAPDPPTQEEWAEGMVAELLAAVKRQMMDDVPVGVLLSGGIDSAAVLAFAAEVAGSSLISYTVGFAESPREDEVVPVAATARRRGVAILPPQGNRSVRSGTGSGDSAIEDGSSLRSWPSSCGTVPSWRAGSPPGGILGTSFRFPPDTFRLHHAGTASRPP